MGLPEEAGKVATGAIEAMKSNPVCLGLLLGWVITLGFSFVALQAERDRAHAETQALIERCFSKGATP